MVLLAFISGTLLVYKFSLSITLFHRLPLLFIWLTLSHGFASLVIVLLFVSRFNLFLCIALSCSTLLYQPCVHPCHLNYLLEAL